LAAHKIKTNQGYESTSEMSEISAAASAKAARQPGADLLRDNPAHGARFRKTKRAPTPLLQACGLKQRDFANVIPVALLVLGTGLSALLVNTPASAAVATFLTAATGLLASHVVRRHIADAPVRRDIRERFESLEDRAWELRESEERYRTMVEAFGDLLVVRDRHGRIANCSDAYAACIGKTVATVKRENIDLFPVVPNKNGSGLADDAIQVTREIMVNSIAGERWFQVLDVPIRDEKLGGSAVLSVARDISQFKRTEMLQAEATAKAQDASNSKSRFLAMVSHEMRTPLNGILGMSKLLSGTSLTGEQKSYNAALADSGKTLLHLIEDMLDLTMIEAGRFERREEIFEVRKLLNGIVELMSPRAFDKNIGLGLYVDPGVPGIVEADQGRLRQILVNLVGNALKFTATGGVKVWCEMASLVTGGQGAVIRFTVHDTGPGLKSADQTRIFEEFERVDNRITRQEDGAGLGLAISRALARELGGRLDLLKSSRHGSVFRLELPISLHQSGNDQEVVLTFEDRKILVVSANQSEADCIGQVLKDKGADVRHVASPKALQHLLEVESRNFDDVLFDIKDWPVPEDETRQIVGAGKKPRLIVLLAPGQRDQLKGLKKAGAVAWLIRPVREQSLFAVLDGKASKVNIPDGPGVSQLPAPANLIRGRVLLAEDNDVNALLATAALKKAGFEVIRATNGREAVGLYKETLKQDQPAAARYDTILMDMHMPVLDGLQALRQIKLAENSGEQQPVPIYVLTADEQKTTRDNVLDAGADGFLVKPLDPNRLVELVSAHCAAIAS
jgi:PAS domain S-box-containing protein